MCGIFSFFLFRVCKLLHWLWLLKHACTTTTTQPATGGGGGGAGAGSKLRERERWRQGFTDTTGDVAEKRVLRTGTDGGGKLKKKELCGKRNHRRFQAVVVDVVAGTGAEPN